jgi:hydrogenase maturation protease
MHRRILLFGIGNPGRCDDGLGPALANKIERLQIEGLTIDSDYQLTVEDSVNVAHHEIVIFADADVSGPEPFSLRPVYPLHSLDFSSHGVCPGTVLGLSKQIFGKSTDAYLFAIRGYEFNEFADGLSYKAQRNLELAVKYIEPKLREICSGFSFSIP